MTQRRFLLDANLSGETARFLVAEFGFDCYDRISAGLGHLPDEDVVSRAIAEGRVIITWDTDFGEFFHRTSQSHAGFIQLRIRDAY